jgi:hypothetical protein
MGLKAMMLPEPYSPLTILFSHSFLIKHKDILEKALKNILLYKNGLFLSISSISFTSTYVDSSHM